MLDSTTTDATTDTTDTEAKTRAPSRRGTLDLAAKRITMSGGDIPDAVYELGEIPAGVVDYLVLAGLRHVLHTAKDEAEAFRGLQCGIRPHREAAPKEMNPWRVACAHAMVEATKKSDAPLTLDAAKEHAAALDRTKLIAAKKRPEVVRHYARLFGAKDDGGLAALIGF